MGSATPKWWQTRLNASRKTGSQYDVTCTWTGEQRAHDTGLIASTLKGLLTSPRRVVDFGAGRGRFAAPITQDWGCEYLGVDILPDLIKEMADRGLRAFLYAGAPLPEEIDGDTAIYCLVLQHLADSDAVRALRATRARQIAIVHGAWHSDGYTTCRDHQQLADLVKQAGTWDSFGFHTLQAPLAKYKILVARRADAS